MPALQPRRWRRSSSSSLMSRHSRHAPATDLPLAELVSEVAPSSFLRPSEQLIQLPNHTGALWSRGLRLPPYALNTSAPIMYLNRYAPTSPTDRAPVLPSLFMPGFPKVDAFCDFCTPHTRTRTHTHTPTHPHTHTPTRTHARTHARAHARTHARARTRTHTRTHARTHARTLYFLTACAAAERHVVAL